MGIGIARYDEGKLQGMIHRKRMEIAAKLDKKVITEDQLKSVCKTLDMDIEEHAKYQELKSLAFAMDEMRLEDAQLLYELLGNSVGIFNAQPVEVKIVLTQLFAELLQKRIVGN